MKRIFTPKRIVILLVVCVLAVSAFIISKYYVQLMLIQGKSMEPTYHSMSLVVIDKHSKKFEVGDVVACKVDNIKGVVVKRIVAGPNDKIQIKDGMLYVNDEISEEMREGKTISYAGIVETPYVLGEEMYFLIGDNYEESHDSRYSDFGPVGQSNIIGKIIN